MWKTGPLEAGSVREKRPSDKIYGEAMLEETLSEEGDAEDKRDGERGS